MKDVVGGNAPSCGLGLIPGGPQASRASVNVGDAEVFSSNHHLWTVSLTCQRPDFRPCLRGIMHSFSRHQQGHSPACRVSFVKISGRCCNLDNSTLNTHSKICTSLERGDIHGEFEEGQSVQVSNGEPPRDSCRYSSPHAQLMSLRYIDGGPACLRPASLASLLLSRDATPFYFPSTRRTTPAFDRAQGQRARAARATRARQLARDRPGWERSEPGPERVDSRGHCTVMVISSRAWRRASLATVLPPPAPACRGGILPYFLWSCTNAGLHGFDKPGPARGQYCSPTLALRSPMQGTASEPPVAVDVAHRAPRMPWTSGFRVQLSDSDPDSLAAPPPRNTI